MFVTCCFFGARGNVTMRIAICDDDLQLCNLIKDNIYEYSNKHNWEPVVDVYISGEAIVKSQVKYDIILMDYQMKGINGLEAAQLLRDGINAFSCIIFLTNFPHIAISAYEVETYRFVVKDTLFDGLFKALDDYRNASKREMKIAVKVEHDTIIISVNDILFIESLDKFLLIHLSNGNVIKTRNTLHSIYNLLPKMNFFKVHKSYIINFQYVASYTENSIKVYNYNLELPVSRNFYKQFKSKYQIYLKDCIQ